MALFGVSELYGDLAVGFLEDESYMSAIITAACERDKLIPVPLDSVEDAVRMARGGVTNFILDITVRGHRLGLDVLEELKRINPDVWVCIYSGHVSSPDQVKRAEQAGADFVQPKTEEPNDDLNAILYILDVHRSRYYALRAEVKRARLKVNPVHRFPVRLALPSESALGVPAPEASRGGFEPSSPDLDENVNLYRKLVRDSEWRSRWSGMVVAIVDGVDVCYGATLGEVLGAVRRDYPEKNRFVTSVEVTEDVIEIATPFDVED